MKYISRENQFELYDHSNVEICNPKSNGNTFEASFFLYSKLRSLLIQIHVSPQTDNGGLGPFVICPKPAETMKQFSGSCSVGASAVFVETAFTGMPPEGLLGRRSTETHTQNEILERSNCLLSLIRLGPHRKQKI
jgi:hypothetical protein